jgi:hypothetical protein
MGKKIAFIDLGHMRGPTAVEALESTEVKGRLSYLADEIYRPFAGCEGSDRDFSGIMNAIRAIASVEALA